jgi:RNase adaptor protein for sRNA GlmZ degradation
MDRQAYDEVVETAARRGSTFVPVFLSASDEAHAQRIPSAEREARLKMTDSAGAALVRQSKPLLAVDHANRLDLDTTNLPASEAALRVIAHAAQRAVNTST